MPEQAVDVNRFEFVELHGPISDWEVVFQAIGAASMCWEKVEAAGVFDSDRAKLIAEALCARLGMTNTPQPEWRVHRTKANDLGEGI